MRISCLLLSFFTLVCLQLWGQEVPRITNYTKEIYKAGSQNWSISQTPSHIICIGNTGGLLAFEGEHWYKFDLPEKQIVRATAVDVEGNIFVGGFGEFGFWSQNEFGEMAYSSLSQELNDGLSRQEEIWHILVQPNKVWFQSFSSIYEYDYEKVEIIRNQGPHSIMFLQKVHQELWLQAIGRGLLTLEPDKEYRFIEGSEFLANYRVVSILPFKASAVLIVTAQHGIFIFENEQFRIWNPALNRLFKDVQINKCIQLSSGNLAVGTLSQGVFLLSTEARLLYQVSQKNGLQNNTVLSLFEDNTHNLWIGLDKGLDYLEINAPLLRMKDLTGKLGTVYTGLLYQNYLYLGTNHGVYRKPWPTPHGFSIDDFEQIDGVFDQIWELRIVDGQLLCGHNQGTSKISGNIATTISDRAGGWCFLRPPNRNLLLQGSYTGLLVYKKDTDGNWEYAHQIKGFSGPVRQLFMDADGSYWGVQPYKGLFRMWIDDSLQTILKLQRFGKEDGLPTEYGIAMSKYPEGLRVHAAQQTFSFDGHKERFVLDVTKSGSSKYFLGNNEDSFTIQPDKILWNKGASTQALDVKLVPDYENIVFLDSGLYLLCLEEGYSLFYPERIQKLLPRPLIPPLISYLKVYNVDKVKQFHFVQNEFQLDLEAGWNQMEFDYSQAIFVTKPKFRYQMEGLSTQWSNWSELSHKEFNNLRPGKYLLRIQSDQSPAEARVHISIAPYWYESHWMWIFYGLAAALIFVTAIKIHNKRLEKQKENLEREQEKELQRQIIQAQNEQLQLNIASKNRELTSSTMSLIRKNEILLKLKEELLNLSSGKRLPLKTSYYQDLLKLIDGQITSQEDWQIFETHFNQVHENFFKRLKENYPDLTPGDLRLAAYLRMNLSSKEVASLLNLSIRGVENKRYRLRKKMGLDATKNLTGYLIAY